jgi:hypothetical protein
MPFSTSFHRVHQVTFSHRQVLFFSQNVIERVKLAYIIPQELLSRRSKGFINTYIRSLGQQSIGISSYVPLGYDTSTALYIDSQPNLL